MDLRIGVAGQFDDAEEDTTSSEYTLMRSDTRTVITKEVPRQKRKATTPPVIGQPTKFMRHVGWSGISHKVGPTTPPSPSPPAQPDYSPTTAVKPPAHQPTSPSPLAQPNNSPLSTSTPGALILPQLAHNQSEDDDLSAHNDCEESELRAPVPSDSSTEFELAFTLVPGISRKGRPKVYDNRGFSYARDGKQNKHGLTRWRCVIRSGNCTAKVHQMGDTFTPFGFHNHTEKKGDLVNAKIKMKVKERVKDNKDKPAGVIVDEVLQEELRDSNAPVEGLLAKQSFTRLGNKTKQVNRPKEPNEQSFAEESIPPGFLREDVWNQERRHIIFAAEEQLQLLAKAEVWYLDATFKVVARPFSQMLSIRAFVSAEDICKQIPLCYALMSAAEKSDYVRVLSAVKSKLTELRVEKCMVNFEEAMWQAIPLALGENIDIQGCEFQGGEAVVTTVKTEVLQEAYSDDEGTRT